MCRHHDSTDKTYGNHRFFDEIIQKWWFKIWVGKSMKIFFIRNAPNTIPLSLKVFRWWLWWYFLEKQWIFHAFSHLTATVGFPIVNQPYHARGRALHCGTRLVAVLQRLYLCEFLELEAQLRICCWHRWILCFPRVLESEIKRASTTTRSRRS